MKKNEMDFFTLQQTNKKLTKTITCQALFQKKKTITCRKSSLGAMVLQKVH